MTAKPVTQSFVYRRPSRRLLQGMNARTLVSCVQRQAGSAGAARGRRSATRSTGISGRAAFRSRMFSLKLRRPVLACSNALVI